MREQRGGKAAVADRADVRAAVGEARHRVRVGQHLPACVEVAVDVVEEGQVEEPVAVVAEHDVERQLGRRRALRGRPGGDRLVERGLVVGLLGHLEEQVVPRDDTSPELVVRPSGLVVEQPAADGGFTQHRDTLVQRPIGELAVDGIGDEGVQCALESEDQAHRPRRHLPGHLQTVVVGPGDVVEEGAELVGRER